MKNLRALERRLDVNLMSAELQIIASLYAHGPTPSQALQTHTLISPAGFHIVKRRLKQRQVIVGMKSQSDLRVTNYDLTAEVREFIDSLFRHPGAESLDQATPVDRRPLPPTALGSGLEAGA